MKNILISSFDMEIGGVERSLINLLESINRDKYNVDLFLYRHYGEFMDILPQYQNILPEVKEYATFRKPIKQIIREGNILLAISRIRAKYKSNKYNFKESGNVQMQLMWKYSIKFLPKLDKKYDIAISYLWPHYFVAEKVNATKKIAWIHTDFSKIETDVEEDLKIWNKYNYIIAVSQECKEAFIKKYPTLLNKVRVIENINSTEFILRMSKCKINEELFNHNSFNIVTVARLSYAKGIDNAVRALKILKDRGLNNIKWYIVGYGGDEEKIRKLVKYNNLQDSFILLGKKVNPYPYIQACDLYVQPSRYEGKAVTVTEAQILSKPVLITNYTTAKSQLNDGVDGYITELSIEGIANGIEKLYRNELLRKKFSENCSINDYSNKSTINKIYSLF